MTNIEVIHAYRHLYRSLLRAVRYSIPARYTVRDQLRDAFRTPLKGSQSGSSLGSTHSSPSSQPPSPSQSQTQALNSSTHQAEEALPPGFDRDAIQRTIWFIDDAARETGMEHRILKNLLFVAWKRRRVERVHWGEIQRRLGKKKVSDVENMRGNAYAHYDLTVQMLNKSLGLCLR